MNVLYVLAALRINGNVINTWKMLAKLNCIYISKFTSDFWAVGFVTNIKKVFMIQDGQIRIQNPFSMVFYLFDGYKQKHIKRNLFVYFNKKSDTTFKLL